MLLILLVKDESSHSCNVGEVPLSLPCFVMCPVKVDSLIYYIIVLSNYYYYFAGFENERCPQIPIYNGKEKLYNNNGNFFLVR